MARLIRFTIAFACGVACVLAAVACEAVSVTSDGDGVTPPGGRQLGRPAPRRALPASDTGGSSEEAHRTASSSDGGMPSDARARRAASSAAGSSSEARPTASSSDAGAPSDAQIPHDAETRRTAPSSDGGEPSSLPARDAGTATDASDAAKPSGPDPEPKPDPEPEPKPKPKPKPDPEPDPEPEPEPEPQPKPRPRDAGVPDEPEPDPGEVSVDALKAKITAVNAVGTLCEAGTYDSGVSGVSGDGAALTIRFSAAELQPGPGEALEGACEITLQLEVPAGFQFGRLAVRPAGYVFAMTVPASLTLDYVFPSSGASQRFVHDDLVGDDSYVFDDVAELWSPTCEDPSRNTILELVLTIGATAEDESYFNVSSLDLVSTAMNGTIWRPCGDTQE